MALLLPAALIACERPSALLMRLSKHGFEHCVKGRFVDQAQRMSEKPTMALLDPPRNDDSSFADNLRAARLRAGLTLEQAAAVIGITNQAISQWENGTTKNPSRANLRKAAEAYNVTLEELENGLSPSSSVFASHTRKSDQTNVHQYGVHGNVNSTDIDVSKQYPPDFEIGLRIEGEVAAGRWIEMLEDIEREHAHHDVYDRLPFAPDPRWRPECQFGLIVRGTSLNRVAVDGDVLSCVNVGGTSYRPRAEDLVIVEQRRDGGHLVERTAKRWHEFDKHYELWPDSNDPRWQTPIKVPKSTGFDVENTDGITIVLKAFVLWVHKPIQAPVRRIR